MKSPKQQLLELRYVTVEADLPDLLASSGSWRTTARIVSERSGMTVSYESLRQWYGRDSEVAA